MCKSKQSYDLEGQYKLIRGQLLFQQGVIKRKHKEAVLLVEGNTDFAFYCKKVQNHIELINVQHIINAVNIRNQPVKVSNCEAIVDILKNRYASIEAGNRINLEIYGIIDLDYDANDEEKADIPNLFVTDTHDLETLLISTDEDIFNKIEVDLTAEQFYTAKLLAYELSDARQTIYINTELFHNKINEEDGTVDYSKLVESNELSLKRILDRIVSQRAYPMDEKTFKKLLETLIVSSMNNVNGYGVYKLRNSPLINLLIQNVWIKANGHDFCSAIMYVSKDAYVKYKQRWSKSMSLADDANYDPMRRLINREMELDIINHYDNSYFTKTKLYKDLYNAVIIHKI